MGEEPGPGAVRSSSLKLLALGVALIAAYFVLAATTTIGDSGDIGGGLILLSAISQQEAWYSSAETYGSTGPATGELVSHSGRRAQTVVATPFEREVLWWFRSGGGFGMSGSSGSGSW